MSVFKERSRSFWMEVNPRPHSTLKANRSADVVIIGSGIAGLSTAYECAIQGLEVIVVDRGPIGRGMTARSSAHLTSALDDFYHEFISIRGLPAARQHFASQQAAIDRIGEICKAERIACDFKRLPAYLFLAGSATRKDLENERDALRSVGLKHVKIEDVPNLSHKLSDGPCLIIPEQGRFHPLKYLDGLTRACSRRGVLFFGETCATKVTESKSDVSIETENGLMLTANAAVVATNSPITSKATLHIKQTPYRTYVIGAAVPKGKIKDVLYWDTEDPYHYVRLHPTRGGEVLLIGGEDHRSGAENDAEVRLRRLERWARVRFPQMGNVIYRWSGQVMDTMDYAAFIGPDPNKRRVFVATGDSGQGITHGVVAGIILSKLIQGRRHRWAKVYSPTRAPLKASTQFLTEAAKALENISERVRGGEIRHPGRLLRGSGGIMRKGLKLFAVCRDLKGNLHRHPATCTHAGCVPHWNTFEQCWDCPCHGSQFAPDGTALNAPAVAGLSAGETDK